MRATLPPHWSSRLSPWPPRAAAAGPPERRRRRTPGRPHRARALRRRRRRVLRPHDLAALRRLPGATSPLAADTRAALGDFGSPQLGTRPLIPGCRLGRRRASSVCSPGTASPSGPFDGTFGDRTSPRSSASSAGRESTRSASPGRRPWLRCGSRLPPRRSSWRGRALARHDAFGPRANRFHTASTTRAPRGTTSLGSRRRHRLLHRPAAGFGTLVVLQHSSGVTPSTATCRGSSSPSASASPAARRRPRRHDRRRDRPHLHFEVRVRDASVDPATAIGWSGAEAAYSAASVFKQPDGAPKSRLRSAREPSTRPDGCGISPCSFDSVERDPSLSCPLEQPGLAGDANRDEQADGRAADLCVREVPRGATAQHRASPLVRRV